MFDKPTSNHTMGLELDSSDLRVAALSLQRGSVVIDALIDLKITPSLSNESDVKPLYTSEQKKEVELLAANHLVVTSLPNLDILIRPLELGLKKDKEIDAVLNFQAVLLLPYTIDNGIIDRIITSKTKEGSKLVVLAARKDHIEAHLNQWKALDIEPEIVTADPVALSAFGSYFAPSITTYFGIHLGDTHSFCTLVIDKKLIASQSISNGLNDLLAPIEEATHSNALTARETLTGELQNGINPQLATILQPHIEAWNMALMRTILSLAKQAKGLEISHILITGPGSCLSTLKKAIEASLNKTQVPCEVEISSNISEQKLCSYALPIGSALSALPNFPDPVNFRKPPFAFPNPWKRMKGPLTLYVGLCLALTFALFLFGNAYIQHKEIAVKQEYLKLLSVLHKTFDEFEKEHPLNDNAKSSIESLTDTQIQARLNLIEKEIAAIPQIFPLQPNVPLVSDVLAWLSTHPSFQPIQDGSPDHHAIKIESLSYTMVKRPEPAKKQEKYQVKVELELSSPTPKMAREFHDALIEPNDFIDPKNEIKWSSSRDRYRTSFFLKDKTIYSTE